MGVKWICYSTSLGQSDESSDVAIRLVDAIITVEVALHDVSSAQQRRGGRGVVSSQARNVRELVGSSQHHAADAVSIGDTDNTQIVSATVVLRRADGTRDDAVRSLASREEKAELLAASDDDIESVCSFLEANKLVVDRVDRYARSVRCHGSVGDVNRAFGTTLEHFVHGDEEYRSYRGALSVDVGLETKIVAIVGLDDRVRARPSFRPHTGLGVSYTPRQVADAYGFSTQLQGNGETVAVIELGGGYQETDLQAYFAGQGITLPVVESVSIDGASNAPTGNPTSADGEVMLDLEVLGSIVPLATLVVYFAPNTDQGFINAIAGAVHDRVHNASVVSISWGGPESSYSSSTVAAFEAILHDATLLDISVCVAAGDGGSADGINDGLAHVDYPAASPSVLACGGTRLTLSGSAIASEVVWNDLPQGGATGGGISAIFPVPTWQASVEVQGSSNPPHGRGRGVPDVSGDADPQTGYDVRVDGTATVFGGTSAVAPLWAALLTQINEKRGTPVGFVNPLLYQSFSGDLRDITQGNNGAYQASVGWDPCTGLGSPNATKLLAAFAGT
ncbi:MAG: S53 family peptidase [Acidimicrobiales bacterium]